MPKFYFRCRSNPRAPLVELDSRWEAEEMKSHPDYDQVDEDGIPMIPEHERMETPILFEPVKAGR